MFNRPLNVRVRKIDPYRRMQHTHPFYIWQVLMRLRTMDKLVGEEGKWHTQADVARLLFSNFEDLGLVDQNMVILCKLKMPMAFLKSHFDIEERFEMVANPNYHMANRHWVDPKIKQDKNEWRARAGAFGDIQALSQEHRQQLTADCMDKDWGYWIGRPDYVARARRWLKKEGIAV